MPEPVDLGKLVDLNPGLGPQPPMTYDGIMEAAGRSTLSDKEIAEKAKEEWDSFPSIWFCNFPDQPSTSMQQRLAEYMQDIKDYRSWASLIWWRTVFSHPDMPQDSSMQSRIRRSAYCARVGVHHMKTTPWLSISRDVNHSKIIECRVEEFHGELIRAVLAGFVGVNARTIEALETVLKSMTKTIEQSSGEAMNKMIACERYEYIRQSDTVRSFVRLVSFAVTQSMRQVSRAKQTSSWVRCTIDYNDYEAGFNRSMWQRSKELIHEQQMKEMEDFINESTVDIPP
ncbi:uncharacterized protein K452DRAFT_303423 [Aplosporella prunicola CBS 121167]|nr:uncharacterized protein K452DRAFT_303423 [Aplosporella prunicola CBS 121167]KAF2135615.1 hypothetical protein K452DRAFT_303423 [Aplosporella prunicola CBS 121167]